MKNIKKVNEDWDYYVKNHRFTKAIFFDEYFGAKSVSLINAEFHPVIQSDITENSLKKIYKNLDVKNFNSQDFIKRYENLVELILYADYLIMLKFEKKKYLDFFKISEAKDNYYMGYLFAPYCLKLRFKYIIEEKTIESNIELYFDKYLEDTLVMNKVRGHDLTLKTDPMTIGDYIIIINKNKD